MAVRKKITRATRRTSRGRARASSATPGSSRGRKTTKAPAPAGYTRVKASDLTAKQLNELAGQLKAAPAAGKPLRGVTVPGVDLKRGSTGGAVKQLQGALVKLRLMTQA